MEIHLFFYKQLGYKQLALGWQITKLLNQQCIKIQLSQKHYWENFKIGDHKYRF